ncbi:hypothetical protein CH282_02740 [Rhodococcus sp. 06-418-1B]|nr:hypothetical protein CH282_02740 [Rhodococcus sp. 06-418-1B]
MVASDAFPNTAVNTCTRGQSTPPNTNRSAVSGIRDNSCPTLNNGRAALCDRPSDTATSVTTCARTVNGSPPVLSAVVVVSASVLSASMRRMSAISHTASTVLARAMFSRTRHTAA